jgi:hypothetical protein
MKPLPPCNCGSVWKVRGREVHLHEEAQDTTSAAWKRLLDLVDEAASREVEEFCPGKMLSPDDWQSIITLPASIAKLKCVKRLLLYGSSLVRLPPEIGDMSALTEFTPYTSYSLHWFPYEITRCAHLTKSCVSTRALYGNYKYRLPFPNLRAEVNANALLATRPISCSICRNPFIDDQFHPRWISLRVATDVLPLLVYACSGRCLSRLPSPPPNYVHKPHFGGRALEQPPRLP